MTLRTRLVASALITTCCVAAVVLVAALLMWHALGSVEEITEEHAEQRALRDIEAGLMAASDRLQGPRPQVEPARVALRRVAEGTARFIQEEHDLVANADTPHEQQEIAEHVREPAAYRREQEQPEEPGHRRMRGSHVGPQRQQVGVKTAGRLPRRIS